MTYLWLGVLVACLSALLGWLLQQKRVRRLIGENTRWRQLAQQRADRVAMLSHEVRMPLSLIRGSSELLEDETAGPLTEDQHELILTIHRNSQQMTHLAEDLLADARMEAELFSFTARPVNLRRLVRRVAADLRSVHRREISVECRGAPPKVHGDPQLLEQALVNVVTNAVRHGRDDEAIWVGIRRTDDMVMVSVTDRGQGIPPEARRALFHRTMEGKSDTGNGLGMLITHKIVQLHGGRLLVDSAEDHGTTVIMALPTPDDHKILSA